MADATRLMTRAYKLHTTSLYIYIYILLPDLVRGCTGKRYVQQHEKLLHPSFSGAIDLNRRVRVSIYRHYHVCGCIKFARRCCDFFLKLTYIGVCNARRGRNQFLFFSSVTAVSSKFVHNDMMCAVIPNVIYAILTSHNSIMKSPKSG